MADYRFLSVLQFAAKHPWTTEKGLRQRIFRAQEAGFAACIKRVGRRVLIDEQAFFAWIDEQNEG